MKTIALIAVKAHSSRVPNKNFRPFDGNRSLLEIKIRQCIDSGAFSDVFVSSDSREAQLICEKQGATFVNRDARLCRDDTQWGDVLEGILESLPISPETRVAWCPATSPLFHKFADLTRALDNNSDNDSLITVTPLSHYYLGPDYIPINHQWGPWHRYSQGMRPIYHFNLACMVAPKSTIIRNQYLVGSHPVYFNIGQFEGLDIDTMEEFEVASLLYRHMMTTL